jgi:shikimate dehydrogenase
MLVAQAAFAVEHFLDISIPTEKLQNVYNKILFNKKNIVLIGMPSCGKSTVGKKIAELLRRSFYDTDDIIEEREKSSIKTIFEQKGEDYFRRLESDVVTEISKLSGVVISTGGGVVLNENNIRWLKKNGKVFFIDRPLENLITTSSRPLSSNRSDLEKLYKTRYSIYKSCADVILKSDDTYEEIKEILKKEI